MRPRCSFVTDQSPEEVRAEFLTAPVIELRSMTGARVRRGQHDDDRRSLRRDLDYVALHLPDTEGQRLLTYTAARGSSSALALALLAR